MASVASRHLVVASFSLLQLLNCTDPESRNASSRPEQEPVQPSPQRPHSPSSQTATPRTPNTSAPPTASSAPLGSDEHLHVPSGIVRAGTRPGIPERRPRFEADLVEIEVPAFFIDRLPYPNDPSKSPKTRVNYIEAAKLCSESGKRLCTELEWERACKGDTEQQFPSGDSFDRSTCIERPRRCLSPFSVAHMGIVAREWTSSPANRGMPETARIARGGHRNAPDSQHRCGSRRAFPEDASSDRLGFRCCSGSAPALEYPTEPLPRSVHHPVQADVSRLRQILNSVPELKSYADEFYPYSSTDMDRALARGNRARDSLGGWELLDDRLLKWFPVPGAQSWVLAGRSGGSGLIAVVHPLPDGRLVHGASFVLDQDESAVAIAFARGYDQELHWSSCWGCGGEGGTIEYRSDAGRFVVTQR
ncbi:MAG: SUMF1/EgtB/PvdO family nonheme iron enzyme [Myxococcota bacterium]